MLFSGYSVILMLWTLTIRVFTAARGQPRIIGTPLPVVAAVGNDVILPCHLVPSFNAKVLTVEWSKPRLKPDSSDQRSGLVFVHVYRDGQEITDMQHLSYAGRTRLFRDELKLGNISLTIMNVSLEDSGTYKCFIPMLGVKVFSFVELIVEPKFVTTKVPLYHTSLQTPELRNETNVRDRRYHLTLLVPAVVLVLFLCGGYALTKASQTASFNGCLAKITCLFTQWNLVPPR